MEVFSVFATLSLVDLISNPLGRVQGAMKSLGLDTSGLGARMGNLALAMTPVALAAGVMLGAFGTCVSTAAGFEDQMAKVGAVSRASAEEMVALEATARELGATTQFTAVQVGEAEQYLAMAGFTAKQNIAALPGVLNLAAATAMDLGRAADISSDILGAFGLQAEEMTRVADTLALTCATANTNMELLGDSMKYVAPVARRAGLSLEETAAMAGLLGNVGIKGSQAGTTLKTMLGKMAAPTKEAQQLFQKLGVTVKDSVGNLRNPVTVLGEMAKSLKNMGTAEQIAAMKAIVGEDAIAGFSELIEKQGIGAIEEYAKQLEAGGGSAAEMAARMNDTLAGSLRGMGSAWESVQISIGKLFIPAVRGAVDGVTVFLRLLDKATQTPFGAALLKIVSAVSMVMVSLTALSAAMWFFSAVGPMIAKALLPLKAAVLGLGAPFWALIAVVGALYLAYKSNFGGIADTLNRWWANTKLVVQGVIAVFQSLKDGSGEIRGELATKIKAAGLVGLVTTVSRIVNRIRLVFKGMMDGISAAMHKVDVILVPVKIAVIDLMDAIGDLFGGMDTNSVGKATSGWQAFGRVIGDIAGGVLIALTEGVAWLVDKVRGMVGVLSDWFGSASQVTGGLESLTGATGEAAAAADPTNWSLLGKAIGAIVAVKAALIACKGVMLVVSGISKAFAAAQWLVNAALAANPVVLITMAIIGLIAAIVYCIANWDAICAKWDEVWSYVGGIIGQVWDSITGKISSAWQGCVDCVSSIGQSLMGGMSSLWDSITQGATESWNAVSQSVSNAWNGITGAATSAGRSLWSGIQSIWDGISSGASNAWNAIASSVSAAGSGIMSGVESIWTGVTDFFSGLSLSESGAKLLDTFKEGIMSKVDAVKQCVSDALAKVRNLLPFSDAKEGPLSTLTLSGSRLMSTIGEGVGQGAPGLLSSVSGALGTVGKAIGDWWTGVRGNRMEMPGIATPDVVQGALPQQAALSAVPRSALPQLSLTPDLRLRDVEIPEADLSGMDISYERRKSEGSGGNTTTNYITISNLTLPGVSDAKSFESDMQRWVGEYNGAMYGYSGV